MSILPVWHQIHLYHFVMSYITANSTLFEPNLVQYGRWIEALLFSVIRVPPVLALQQSARKR